jgi:ferric iron reductase protein FhuF
MIPSLAPCFTGTFLQFKNRLALPGEYTSSVPGRDLFDADIKERLVSRFAETHPGGDRRAIVSMWTQWHFGALIIPTTAAILFLDRDLPIELDRVRIALHEGGQTAAIILPDEGAPRATEISGRFSRLFLGHVEPLISNFAAQFRISPRMLWNNAADIFEWTLRQAEDAGKADAAILEEGLELLLSRHGWNGVANPMLGLVRYSQKDGRQERRRKVCCLRYLLPGVECCGGICPLPPTGR